MKKAHIFDMDGTLVDSMPTWSEKMLSILREDSVGFPDDIIKTITPLGDRGTAELFLKMGVKNTCVEEVIARMDAFAEPKYAHDIVLKPFVREYLLKLRTYGCRLYVLTASPHKMTDPCLKNNGIFDLLDEVWTTDDFGLTKDKPDIYLKAADRLGCTADDIVFYDDNINALKGGKAAGLETVGVYDASSADSTEEIKRFADRYVTSFEELI